MIIKIQGQRFSQKKNKIVTYMISKIKKFNNFYIILIDEVFKV